MEIHCIYIMILEKKHSLNLMACLLLQFYRNVKSLFIFNSVSAMCFCSKFPSTGHKVNCS